MFQLPRIVRQYFEDNTHRGLPQDPDCIIKLGHLSIGRVVYIGVTFRGECIQEIGFQAFGDAYLIGVFSWLCSQLVQRKIHFASTLTLEAISHTLDLPDHKMSCAFLAEDGLKQLMEFYNDRK